LNTFKLYSSFSHHTFEAAVAYLHEPSPQMRSRAVGTRGPAVRGVQESHPGHFLCLALFTWIRCIIFSQQSRD